MLGLDLSERRSLSDHDQILQTMSISKTDHRQTKDEWIDICLRVFMDNPANIDTVYNVHEHALLQSRNNMTNEFTDCMCTKAI